jgi:hypothetical protein
MAKHFTFCHSDVLRPGLIATLGEAGIATISDSVFLNIDLKNQYNTVGPYGSI